MESPVRKVGEVVAMVHIIKNAAGEIDSVIAFCSNDQVESAALAVNQAWWRACAACDGGPLETYALAAADLELEVAEPASHATLISAYLLKQGAYKIDVMVWRFSSPVGL